MESVLEVYQSPYDWQYPVVCLDESLKQLVKETRIPIEAKPGKPRRFDYQYERNGTANLFMLCNPLESWRDIVVTHRRTAIDYAKVLAALVDDYFPLAQRIIVVQDQLNTHTGASLYKAFEPQEARRLLDKLEFCYTPKHGSWLNMAEIEFSILSRQCLSRRIPDMSTLIEETALWCEGRNRENAWIDWRFTTDDARIKLKHLYPSIIY